MFVMFTANTVFAVTIVVKLVKTIAPITVKVVAIVTFVVITVAVVTVAAVVMCVVIVTVVTVVVVVMVEINVTFAIVPRADVKSVVSPVSFPVVMVANTNYAIITAILFKNCRRIKILNNIIINIIITRITIVSSKKIQSLPSSFSVSISLSLSLSLSLFCLIFLTRFYCLWSSTCLVKSNPSVNKNEQPINLSPALPSGF